MGGQGMVLRFPPTRHRLAKWHTRCEAGSQSHGSPAPGRPPGYRTSCKFSRYWSMSARWPSSPHEEGREDLKNNKAGRFRQGMMGGYGRPFLGVSRRADHPTARPRFELRLNPDLITRPPSSLPAQPLQTPATRVAVTRISAHRLPLNSSARSVQSASRLPRNGKGWRSQPVDATRA